MLRGQMSTAPPLGLRRELGRWDLTAIGINQVIGAGIFLIPAAVAAQLGSWSWIGVVVAGMASLLVALCFAEAGSRFESTGGPYLYSRAAFGRFVGFEVGWMQWFTRVCSQAAVVNGIAVALAFYWPPISSGIGRATIIIAVTLTFAIINVRGIRSSAWVVKALTIAKLAPLAILIAVGIFFVDRSRLIPSGAISARQAAEGMLLLIFLFGGYDVVPVPAGEATGPKKQVPFALVTTILAVTAIMTAAQVVAQGTLADEAHSKTPLADAAFVTMGSLGALLIGAGSVISMIGHNAGGLLSGPRVLFALAENRELPRWFGEIHPRFRTPANAVVFTSAVSLALALSGSLEKLAIASAVARLVPYISACAATLMLRRPRYAGLVGPAVFVIPFGPTIPLLGLTISVAILAGATGIQALSGLAALAAGAAFFAIGSRTRASEVANPAAS